MKAALSIGMMGLIDGIENNQVTFHDDETKALTYGLLCAVMVEVHGHATTLTIINIPTCQNMTRELSKTQLSLRWKRCGSIGHTAKCGH